MKTHHRGHFDAKDAPLLLLALAGSLAGDVFLLFEGFFVGGLGSFLLAHLAYLVLLRRGQRWLAWRGALLAMLAVGAGMYAFLWQGGLPAGLRGPVAVYVAAIALMAAQALARARHLGGWAAWQVAVGALLFVASDALLATNRFVQPLALAPLGVLGTYFAAQSLIVGGLLRAAAAPEPALTARALPAAG